MRKAGGAQPRKRLSWRRVVGNGVALLVGLVLLAGVAWLARNAWLPPLAIAWAQRALERDQGLVLTVDELVIDSPRSVTARGITLAPLADGPGLQRLALGSAQVRFDLRRLWSGEADWLEGLELADAFVRLDTSGPAAADGGALQLPERLPPILLRRCDLELRLDAERRVAVRGLALSIEPVAGGLQPWGLSVERLELDGVLPGLRQLGVRTRGSYAAGRVELTELDLAGDLPAHFGPTTADLSGVADGRVALRGAAEIFGGRVGFDLRGADSAWGGHVEADDVALGELERFVPFLALTGRLSVVGDAFAADGRVWCSAKGAAGDVCVEGRWIDALDFDLTLDPESVSVTALDLRQGVNSALAREVRIPLGAPSALESLRASRGRIELDLHDLTALTAPARNLPGHHVVLAGVLDDDGVALESGTLVTGGGRFVVRRGRVTWSASGSEFASGSSFDVDLSTEFDDLAGIGALLGTDRWAGALTGTLHLSGTPTAPVGELDLVGSDVVAAGYELGQIAAVAQVDGERLRVQTLEARGTLGQLTLDGEYVLREQRLERARVSASSDRLAQLLPDRIEAGAVEISADISGPWRDPSGSFELVATELAVSGLDWLSAVRCSGSCGGGSVRFERLEARLADFSARLSGSIEHTDWNLPLTVTLDTGALESDGLELGLTRACHLFVAEDQVVLDDFELGGSGGSVRGSFVQHADDLELRLASDELEPMRWVAALLPPEVSIGTSRVDVAVSRNAGRWSGGGEVEVDDLWVAPDVPPVKLGLRLAAADGVARIERLSAVTPGVLDVALEGRLPFDEEHPLELRDGPIDFDLRIDLRELRALPWSRWTEAAEVDGELAGHARLTGSWSVPCGFIELVGHRLNYVPSDARGVVFETPLSSAELTARLTLDEDVRLDEFRLRGGDVNVDLEGRCLRREDQERLLDSRGARWREAELDLRGAWSIGDLSLLGELLPGIRRMRGECSGELALSGAWGAPEGHGSCVLRQGELRLATELPALEELQGSATLAGSRLEIHDLRGELGAGPFALDGAIDLSGAEPRFDLQLHGQELLLVQQSELRVRADADLGLQGPLSELVLSGKLATRDSRWKSNIDWFSTGGTQRARGNARGTLFSIQRGPFARMRFDVEITSRERLAIETNIARGGLRAELRLAGTGIAPALTGALFIDPTRVFLPASTLQLRSGTLTLERRDPLDPRLELQLATRVQGYDVTLRVSGTLSAPELEMSSAPPLPAEDILLLVVAGRPPGDSLGGESGADAAGTVMVYLGRDLAGRLFDGDVSLLERVEWQTGADVTQAGGLTAQVMVRVLGPADGEGRAVYLRGERDVYDRTNYGMRFVLRLR